jgi:NO-binding membrane sensor protein with MHYT domain
LPGHYDLWTVFCSFLIACLAGFVAFESVDHTRYSKAFGGWVFFGGVTLGLGIWSMHFMGMLAWHPPFALYYFSQQNTPVGFGGNMRILAGPATGGAGPPAKISHR